MTKLLTIAPVSLPKDVEPSADVGERGRLAWLPIAALRIDARYQRDVVNKGVAVISKIVGEFRWSKFQPLTVAEIEPDVYAVIDGQHRAIGAAMHPELTEVPCWIVPAPVLRAQASTFLAINRDRTTMSIGAMFYAGVAAGDPDMVHIKKVVDAAGVIVMRSAGKAPPRHTYAVSTIRKLLAAYGDGPVIEALTILVETFPEYPEALRGQIIHALTLFYVEHRKHENYDRARMQSRLGKLDLDEELKSSRMMRAHFGGSTEEVLKRRIVQAYNKGAVRKLPEPDAPKVAA